VPADPTVPARRYLGDADRREEARRLALFADERAAILANHRLSDAERNEEAARIQRLMAITSASHAAYRAARGYL
jgi:hypothetical protein